MAAALDTGRGDELDFTDYISRILPALLAAMSSTDADVVVAASNAATEIVKAVPDDTLMETLSELIKGLNSHNAETRAGASRLVEAFAKGSKANYESQVPFNCLPSNTVCPQLTYSTNTRSPSSSSPFCGS